MTLGIDIVCEFMGHETSTVWQLLQQSHESLLCGSRVCYLYADECVLDQVSEEIKRLGMVHFGVSFEQGSLLSDIQYGHVRNFDHSLIRVERVVSGVADAWSWIEPFSRQSGFCAAWIRDLPYEYWQNAEDPLQYESEGRSYKGLPMKWNGLPRPLKRKIIDITGNPGRRVLRCGYVEAVGAVMWLGERFWSVTGTGKQDVLAQDWIICQELPCSVLRVQASNQPFTSAEGDEGQKQDRLRALLFPHQD